MLAPPSTESGASLPNSIGSGSPFGRETDYLRRALRRIQRADQCLRHLQSGVEARSGRTSVPISAALQGALAGLGGGSGGSSDVRFAYRGRIRLMNFKTTGPQSGARTMQSGHPDLLRRIWIFPLDAQPSSSSRMPARALKSRRSRNSQARFDTEESFSQY